MSNDPLSGKPVELTAAQRAKAMTFGDWSDMIPALANGVSDRINRHILASERIGKLEARIAELEAAAQNSYKGIWSPEVKYVVGNMATHAGAMWVACSTNQNSKPGATGSGAWQLCLKRGAADHDNKGPTVA